MKIEYYDFNQPFPGIWKETIVFEIVDHFIKHCKQNHWIYDTDNSGSNYYDFLVRPINKVIRIHQNWYWENWIDLQERYVENEFTFEIIPIDKIDKQYPSKNRDFLKI